VKIKKCIINISELVLGPECILFASYVVHPLMFRDQKAERSHNIKIANSSFQSSDIWEQL
jgi:hypothetical protein